MSNVPDGEVPFDSAFVAEQFSAERLYLYVNQALSDYPALAQNSKLLNHVSLTLDQMVFQITTWCAAGRIPDNVFTRTVSWPDGVWQTFKEKFMPEWFKTRWPVRMKSETFTVTHNTYFVCPHLVADSKEEHIRFMATGTRFANMMRGH